MERSPELDPKALRAIEAEALTMQARARSPKVMRDIQARAQRMVGRQGGAQTPEAQTQARQARLDPQVVRDVETEALEQQAHLARAHPMPQEPPRGLRRWLRRT